MKEHIRFIIKGVGFVGGLFIVLLLLNRIMLPKKYFNTIWSETSSCENFYKMDRNTIDVLFLGSSHCMSSFSPQELYDNYGLRGYNLGTEQQSLLISYFWLKEALRYQHPSVVVLDTFICFTYKSEEPLNSDEAAVRMAIDPMKWSEVKTEAVAAICKNDNKQSVISYYNPLIRFHTRWSALNEDDFTFFELSTHDEMKGYSILSNSCGNNDYQPFVVGSSDTVAEMVPLMKEYLDKIVELCAEHEIQLVLVKTPATLATIEKYNCLTAYAREHQIKYYDFNEDSLYHEIDYQFAVDNDDNEHINYRGAKKISIKIAEILTGDPYQVLPRQDIQWEKSRDFYRDSIENAQLHYITNIEEYLEIIRDDRFAVFIAIKDEVSDNMNENIVQQMQLLGLNIDLRENYKNSYYAVISSEKILEEVGTQRLSTQGVFRNGRSTYSISSATNECSIKIDNTEYAKNQKGLNIVVYDTTYNKVIDSVCFDIYAETLDALR